MVAAGAPNDGVAGGALLFFVAVPIEKPPTAGALKANPALDGALSTGAATGVGAVKPPPNAKLGVAAGAVAAAVAAAGAAGVVANGFEMADVPKVPKLGAAELDDDDADEEAEAAAVPNAGIANPAVAGAEVDAEAGADAAANELVDDVAALLAAPKLGAPKAPEAKGFVSVVVVAKGLVIEPAAPKEKDGAGFAGEASVPSSSPSFFAPPPASSSWQSV